jgi:MYXO-CTERM domain-containing protein
VPVLLSHLALSASAATCGAWSEAESLATVSGAPFSEASGIAAARTRDDVWFVHGDNGDDPVLLAVDRAGKVLDVHRVVDAENEDWEDLAAAPCPDDGDCLYIGDIGDNDELRPNVTVYVVREPEAGDDKLKSIRRYVGVYPDGPHDAEGLMVDPCTGQIHVVTKEDPTRVFAFPFDPDDTVTLEDVAEFALPGPTRDARQVTSADWDPDGDRFVLRGSDRKYLFTVDPDVRESSWALPPEVLVGTDEVQGEGVCFAPDGNLYTTGEGSPIPLSVAACDDPGPANDVCVFPQTGRTCGCATGSAAGSVAPLLLGLLAVRRRR